MTNINEIIHKIWGENPVSYEPLNGGFVNFTYKVLAGGKNFVLRINGRQNDHLGLNRLDEVKVMRMAGELGIAPKVLPQSTAEYLITEFVDAPVLNRDDILTPAIIKKVMKVLKKLHSIQYNGRSFSPFDLLDKHLAGMKNLGIPFPKELNDFLPEIEAAKERFDKSAAYRKAYCHNDFYTFNMLNSDNLYVIDWELSGMGDIFFDIATLSFHDAFSTGQDKFMLECYFGQALPEHFAALNDMKFMNMLREATWGLLHSGMNEDTVNHNMDYYEHGINTLNKLKAGFLHL
ncbi:MAG: phosphotransferase [Lachnospiraceae bacterium]|nr:phosphotransferase [Lachnospiraceae bacterium]